MYRQCAIIIRRSVVSERRRRTLYICDTFDRSVRCKEGPSAELVGGLVNNRKGQSSSDRVRR